MEARLQGPKELGDVLLITERGQVAGEIMCVWGREIGHVYLLFPEICCFVFQGLTDKYIFQQQAGGIDA